MAAFNARADGSKAVAQAVQRHTLPDPGCIRRSSNSPLRCRSSFGLPGLDQEKQPAFLKGYCDIETPARHPPLSLEAAAASSRRSTTVQNHILVRSTSNSCRANAVEAHSG